MDRVVENDDGIINNVIIYVDYIEVSKLINSLFYSLDKWEFLF